LSSPIEEKFALSNNVISALHKLVKENGITYLDAAVHHSSVTGIEIEVIAEIISKDPLIKLQVEIDGENLHFLKKQNRLPI
jgi:hypothetical protein